MAALAADLNCDERVSLERYRLERLCGVYASGLALQVYNPHRMDDLMSSDLPHPEVQKLYACHVLCP